MILLRSLLFYLLMAVTTVIFGLLSIIVRPLPFNWRYYIVTRWTHLNLWSLQVLCRLRYRVTGHENIPAGPAIIMCKHQSAWETMALQAIFPPQVWVMKRELLRIPLLGWGLASLDPIAIDRGAGMSALNQLAAQGRDRLQTGRWIAIFPEGTRVAPGAKRRYGIGGGFLAEQTGYPVVPVVHNAGLFWPRKRISKQPGTIDVEIGPVIDPTGRNAKKIMSEVETWIETRSDRLIGEQHAADNAGTGTRQEH